MPIVDKTNTNSKTSNDLLMVCFPCIDEHLICASHISRPKHDQPHSIPSHFASDRRVSKYCLLQIIVCLWVLAHHTQSESHSMLDNFTMCNLEPLSQVTFYHNPH